MACCLFCLLNVFLWFYLYHLSPKFASRMFSWVYLSDACFLGPVYRRLRILAGWERSALPVWGHQSLWHHQAADQWVVRSGSLDPAPFQRSLNFLKADRELKPVSLTLASLGHPGQQWIRKTKQYEKEREEKIKFCCAVDVYSTADTSTVLAYFCPACGQYGFWSVKQRRTA